MKQKACVIIGDSFTFPDGDAATNRVYTYAKGFLGHGVKVHIICFRNDYQLTHTGETEGVKYYYPFAQTERSRWFIVRRWNNLMKFYNTLRIFSEIRKEYDVWLVMAYTIRLYTQVFAYLLSRLSGATHVLERSEHPFKSYNSKLSEAIFGRTRIWIEIVFSNQIFCISDYLMDFYKKRGASVDRLFKVPSTVDPFRFSGIHARLFEKRYICYSGSLTLMKDGVDILIRSFSRISPVFPDLMLVLVGKADTVQDEQYLRNLVIDLNINEKVTFTGKVPRNIVPSFICNAHVLALARPRSIVADAGFPSKVSEYLSTGIPVVTTKVGEISMYLTNNQNAFLSEPDSVEEFAEKLKAVLDDYPHARDVGLKGQEIALTEFNYLYQTKRIIKHLEKLQLNG